jgi:hydrogenase nickel incorporation protein HypA/HybF
MHELSVAMSLVEAASDKARGLGDVRVDAVYVRLGPLSGVVRDALLFCFDLAAEGTPVAGARLEIEDVALTAFCPKCGEAREILSSQHLHCPVCGAATPDVIGGRELELTALEVDDRATHR